MSSFGDIWQAIHQVLSDPALQGIGTVISIAGSSIAIFSRKSSEPTNSPAQKEKTVATFKTTLPYFQHISPNKQPLLKKITSVVGRKYYFAHNYLRKSRQCYTKCQVIHSQRFQPSKKISTLYQTYTGKIPETSSNIIKKNPISISLVQV